ncbi:condensation domain-containing protein [Streptomyces sp. NBC_00075]
MMRWDDLVGLFLNTLVLRTDTSGDPSFAEVLGRAREVALTAYDHQDVPFDLLVEVLNPARTVAHNLLFQVMLALQNNAQAELELPGLRLSTFQVSWGTSKFDPNFNMLDFFAEDGTPQGIEGLIEYSTDVFDEATAVDIFHRWAGFLRDVVETPDRPLSQVNVLLPGEKERFLTEWNGARGAAGRGGRRP